MTSPATKSPPAVSEAPAPSPGLFPPWVRHLARTGLHFLADAGAVAASYYLAYQARFGWTWWVERFPPAGVAAAWPVYGGMLYAVIPLWLMIFGYSCRLYTNPWMHSTDRFLQILKGCVYGTLATMVATYIYQRLGYSRMMLGMVLPIALILVSTGHFLVLWIDAGLARLEAANPVLLVGGGLVAGVVKERIGRRHPGAGIHELADLPGPAELEKVLGERRVMELILLNSSLPHSRILEAAEVCDSLDVAFKMVPDLLELRLGEVQMDHSLGLPAYRIQHTSMTRLNFLAKRTFDLVFSGLVLVFAALPLGLACLLIKLDSQGPILYKQKRYGFKGRVFEAFKFRTMVADAESRIDSVRELNAQEGAFFKAKDDPRVTGVGKFLRRFSLDEFPQFLNVLRGEMSVVGPRPLALTTGEIERLEKDFGATAKKRMNILPGITGLWQVSGRSDVSSEQRFAIDIFYIEHWSLGMDLEIILKTVPAMLFGKGAY